MNPRSTLLVALLAAGFAYQPGNPSARPDTKNKPPAPANAGGAVTYDQKLPVKDWPRETLHEFLATPTIAKKESADAVCPLGKGYTLDFLIATIPDPQNSHYPYLFDELVEGIRRAAGNNRYDPDRFWLPWSTEGAPADTDWMKREQYLDYQTQKQQYPGILVFRRDGNQVLSVLLVGENPVFGINKQQFDNALELIGHFKGRPIGQVKVLGPAFSGAIDSLGIAMQTLNTDAAGRPRGITNYKVITGSATGRRNGDWLKEYTKRGAPPIDYSATVENDHIALTRFLEFLRQKSNQIAILAEEGSSYADQFVKHAGAGHTLFLRYPMEISRLRNAYADNSELTALSDHAAGMPKQGLQMTLKDSHSTDDSVPAFSGDLSAIAQESAFMSTLGVLSRQRIEYVGIVASDVLDGIFLGRMLKKHCPDLRLFIFTSDLVYASLAQNRAFIGMMMVTTYPLYPANEVWTHSFDPEQSSLRIFSSTAIQGEYNACFRLITDDQPGPMPLAEYAPPSWEKSGRQEPPDLNSPQRPALWVSLVGHDGLWPLTTLQPQPAEGTSWVPSLQQKFYDKPLPHRPPLTWDLVLYFTTVLCLAFALAVWWWNSTPEEDNAVHRDLLSMFRIAKKTEWRDRISLIAAAVALLVPACFVSAIEIEYIRWYDLLGLSAELQGTIILHAWINAALCVLGPALVLGGIVCCFQPRRSWRLGIAVACLAVPAIFCALIYHFKWLTLPYVYRSVHLGNGVSPFVPVLLLSAALAWYAGAHLNRVRLCRFAPPELPSFENDPFLGGNPKAARQDKQSVKGSLQDAYQRMSQALDDFWFNDWSIVAAVIWVLSIFLWWLTAKQLLSIEEGHSFERFYTVALFVIYGTLLLACARFVHLWLGLRRMLHMLEQHPIRKWIKRLAPERSLSPAAAWKLGGSRRTDMTLACSIERLRIVAGQAGAAPFYGEQLEILETNAGLINAADSCGEAVPADALRDVNKALSDVADDLAGGVIQRAPARLGADRDGAATAPAFEPFTLAACNAAQEFVAIRFAAVIRYATLHMKNLLEFVGGALILAIASLMSYPFEPHNFIMTAISTCFFIMSGVFLFAMIQMNRNTIISYLSGTKPGKIDANFLHVASFGSLPLITVISAQFPSIGGFLFAWLKPALEALK